MPASKRVIVVGATGEIGRALSARLLREPAYALVVFSRDPDAARQKVPDAAEYVAWEPAETGPWAAAVDGAYAVVNMAGAPSFGVRWTPAYRAFLHTNRTTILHGLVRAMEEATMRPSVFIAASAVGAYGFTSKGTQEVTEDTPGDDDTYGTESRLLEGEALRAEALGVRTVLPRTGFILDRAGGGLPGLAKSMRGFTGGIILPGTQYLPWIHIEDEVGILVRALEDERVRGPLNATAPEALTNREFMRTLARLLHRPVPMRVPGVVLRRFMGDASAILTSGRRVVPRKMLDLGYQFEYPTLLQALRNLLDLPER
jgi:uncharacterized protein (TIGR01777 family)